MQKENVQHFCFFLQNINLATTMTKVKEFSLVDKEEKREYT